MILAEKFVNLRPVSNATVKRHFSVRWASVYVLDESGVVQERPRAGFSEPLPGLYANEEATQAQRGDGIPS